MKIIETLWFAGMYGFCGIVLAETELEGEHRAYIGVHAGQGTTADQRLIAEGGTRISPEIAAKLHKFLSGE